MADIKKNILLLPGDGIGPEIIDQAKKVLDEIKSNNLFDFSLETGYIGGAAYDKYKDPFPSDTIENATAQSLANVRNVLEGADLSLNDVVKASVFMIDSEDYSGMNKAYCEIMPQPYPAREAIFVKGLPKGARVEISVIAHSK